MNLDEFIEIFKKHNRYDQFQELNFEIVSPGEIIYKMTVLEKHLSLPPTAHGGTIAGFMDCVLGLAALSEAVTRGSLTSTVEFKINFIRPAKLHDHLIGHGKVIHKGKSLLISSGEIKTSSGELVAIGQGTFNTYPFHKKEFSNEYLTSN
jgi:uncharacterized protein (TIGR00369 family)